MKADEIKSYIAQRLADVAAFNGCFGKEDGVCIELRPDDPVEWCKYCVQGAAAKLLRAGHAPASETPQLRVAAKALADVLGGILNYGGAKALVAGDNRWVGRFHEASKALSILRDVLETVPTPASETGQASAWQTMESAPKDRDILLGAAPTPAITRWLVDVGRHETTGGVGEPLKHSWGWRWPLVTPTHWMLLPLAPSEDETTTK